MTTRTTPTGTGGRTVRTRIAAIATLLPPALAGVGDALANDGPSAASGSIAHGLSLAPLPLNLKIRDGDAGPPAR